MNPVAIALSVALPLVMGVVLLRRVQIHRLAHPALLVGAGFGVGIAFIGIVLAGVALVGLPLTRATGFSSVLLVWAALLGTLRYQEGRHVVGWTMTSPVVPAAAIGWWWQSVWWVGVIALGIKCAMVGIRAMHKPVIGWDSMLVHSFKAKEMFYDQTIGMATLDWAGSPNYPLGMSLVQLWVAWFSGSWDDSAFKILFPCILGAVFLVVYGGLRELVGPIGALGGTWFTASLPLLVQHATDAYVDLPLAYTTLAISVFLWRYTRSRSWRDLLIASWFAGFGVWTKNEGTVAVAVAGLMLWTFLVLDRQDGWRRAWADLVRFSVWPAVVWGGWGIVKARWGIGANLDVSVAGVLAHVDRLPTVAGFIASELWQSANWNVLWAVFLGGWVVWWRRYADPVSLFFGWPVLLTLGVFSLVAASTEMFDVLFNHVVLHRMVLHVAPLAVFWAVAMFGQVGRSTAQ